MRKSSRVSAPLLIVTLFYGICFALFQGTAYFFPGFEAYLPMGGLETLMGRSADTFNEMEVMGSRPLTEETPSQLGLAIVCAMLLMVPISWVYFITTRDNRIDRSFAQTMIILPVIVAAIATIVQYSLPLAFSLAGIVAAVRFRFTLTEPAHTLYIFAAITIGLGAGVSAIEVAVVISMAFVYTTLLLWRLDYGRNLNTPFFSFLTGRDHQEKDE